MTLAQEIMIWGGGAAVGITAVLALIRALRGPTVLDRMIASDVVLTTIVIGLGIDMAVRGHQDSIVLMIVISATAVFATIMVARHVSKQTGSGSPTGLHVPSYDSSDSEKGAQ